MRFALIAGLALAAWSNGFDGEFVFDDVTAIVENPHLRRLFPLSESMSAPPQTTAAGRPMLSLSLAVNYAVGGLDVRGYHVFNLALHVLNGWLLFVLVRLLMRRGTGGGDPRDDRVAIFTALLWTLHPIQTESVTYVVQRAESIMAFFYLATLVASVRFLHGGNPWLWAALAVAACALGMASKEVMAVAPASVLLLDRMDRAADDRGHDRGQGRRPDLRARVAFHAALWFTLAILAGLMISGPRDESAGFGLEGITPMTYAAAQFGVITNYLRLVFWPAPLVLDYQWSPARTALEVIPPMLLVLGLLGVTLRGVILGRRLSIPLALMFLLLAPTSTFVPIADLAFVHRMYLPMAGPLFLFALAADSLATGSARRRRVAGAATVTVIAALALITRERNESYRTAISVFEDVVRKRPLNYRSHNNLGVALLDAGRYEEAARCFATAFGIKDDYPDAWYNLGNVMMDTGNLAEAARMFNEALARDPAHPGALCNLGSVIAQQGDPAAALEYLDRSLALDPRNAEAYVNKAVALLELGRSDEAETALRECLAQKPDFEHARNLLNEL